MWSPLSSELYENTYFFIEIITAKGHRSNISRPSEKMSDLKNKFIESI